MEALYGPEWKDQLAMAGGCLVRVRGRKRGGRRASHYSGQGTGRRVRPAKGGEPPAMRQAGSVASSTVGGESVFRDMSLGRLQGVFLKDYTPESETKRMRRVSCLEKR